MMLRIAMLQDDWWPIPGGGPTHVRELSIALAENFGHYVDIFTRALKKDDETYTEQKTYAEGQVQVNRLGPVTNYWNSVGRLASVVSPIPHVIRGNYDIIHGHTFLPAFPTMSGGVITGTPSVFTVHGMAMNTGIGRDRSRIGMVKRWIEKLFVLKFTYDHVISVNKHNMELLGDYHSSVSYIPNGVDLDRFEGQMERRRDILFVGRLDPKKRVSDLIEAFGNIAGDYADVRLVIVGTGSVEDNLKQQAKSTNGSERISFEGKVPDCEIPRYYQSSEVFVLPSMWEGHPLTLLEAWAAGVPVIATEIEGIEEFVYHKSNGFLVPPASPNKLADALRYVLDNPRTARCWAEQGHDQVRSEYSWKTVARRTRDVYMKTIT